VTTLLHLSLGSASLSTLRLLVRSANPSGLSNVPPQNRQSLSVVRVDEEVARASALNPVALAIRVGVGLADDVADVFRLSPNVAGDVYDRFWVERKKLVLFFGSESG
jgi:hypothetical protein